MLQKIYSFLLLQKKLHVSVVLHYIVGYVTKIPFEKEVEREE